MAGLDSLHVFLLIGAFLIVAGILSSLVASRFGTPLLLVFLVVGMVAGEDGPGGLAFSDYRLSYVIGSLSLAIILFDGGLRTKLAQLKGVVAPSFTLATLGVLITAVITGLAAREILNLNTIPALLVGSVVASTDAAAILFLLRAGGLQLKRRVGTTLELESSLNDPVTVLLTLLLIDLGVMGEASHSVASVVLHLMQELTLGLAVGAAAGAVTVYLLNRLTFPEGLHPLFAAAMAVLVFGLTTLVGGSGFLAVYIAGLILGNRSVRAFPSILAFHDTLTWLCQIIMFVLLGLLVTPSRMVDYALPAVIVAAILTFVARPVAVFACLSPFGFGWRENLFASWVGLRGAVSIFLAAIPTLAGLPGAELYFNIAFFVVLISLALQGWTVRPAARLTGMLLPRNAIPVQRIDIDLPGQKDYELVGYPIHARHSLKGRAIPSDVRPMLIMRGGDVLEPAELKSIQDGDYAYFLAPHHRIGTLDRLFAQWAEAKGETLTEGEFPFLGSVTLGEVAGLYGLTLDPAEATQTVADLFAARFDGDPLPGDIYTLGPLRLTVRGVEDDRVTMIGLRIREIEPSNRRILARLRRWRLT